MSVEALLLLIVIHTVDLTLLTKLEVAGLPVKDRSSEGGSPKSM